MFRRVRASPNIPLPVSQTGDEQIMALQSLKKGKSVRQQVSKEEWDRRVDLAAAYRLIHRLGLDDSIYTHISARLPGRQDRFLINPYGLRFEEVTASNLVTVDLDGNVIDDPMGLGINPAGFTIHSAIHAARHDAICVLHTHTVAGIAVACQKRGLLPLNQWSMQFTDCLAYHDYEGIALDLDERQRLDGFGFDVEDLFIAHRLGLATIEVPVKWNNVEGTKVGLSQGLRSFLDLLVIRWNGIRGLYG
jgi:hypothetical protein